MRNLTASKCEHSQVHDQHEGMTEWLAAIPKQTSATLEALQAGKRLTDKRNHVRTGAYRFIIRISVHRFGKVVPWLN
jgi:hypothetical protein